GDEGDSLRLDAGEGEGRALRGGARVGALVVAALAGGPGPARARERGVVHRQGGASLRARAGGVPRVVGHGDREAVGVGGLAGEAGSVAVKVGAAGGTVVAVSRRNTSLKPLVSPGTRLEASERKATKRPSALVAGSKLGPLA